jgi:hypothetical protein
VKPKERSGCKASCLTLDSSRATEYLDWPSQGGGRHDEDVSVIRYELGTAVGVAGANVVLLKGWLVHGRSKGLSVSRTVTRRMLLGPRPLDFVDGSTPGRGGVRVADRMVQEDTL